MKKCLFFAAPLLVCFFLVAGSRQSAQEIPGRGGIKTPVDQRLPSADQDAALAKDIRKVTNRSGDGLVQQKLKNGLTKIDLKGRFQNAALVRMGDSGEAENACITDISEANAFFGRDLETGIALPKTQFPFESEADRYGMSQRELDFYLNMIKEAEARRLMSPASATIVIQNNDGAGEGFNDPAPAFVVGEGGNAGTTLGQQRLNVFNFAAAIWGAFLESNVTTTVNSTFDPKTCSSGSAVLGSAGTNNIFSNIPGEPFPNTLYHDALTNKIYGADAVPGSGEINASFSSNFDTGCFAAGHRFYYGLDGSTPANRTNLLVVLLHEMGHGLGFSSFVTGTTGALLGGKPDIYTQFMIDASTGKTWVQMSDAERVVSAKNNGNVYWDGPSVKLASSFLANGRDASTGRVKLYTPTTFSGGSSISHFDISASPNLLMEPNINAGLAIDGDLTRQQLRDIGWYRDTSADHSADTITSVTPNTGVKVIGTSATITWATTGGFNQNVSIELSTDGGATYPTTLASNIPNTG